MDSKTDRERVAKCITWTIVDFLRLRIKSRRRQFHADDLRGYVNTMVGRAGAVAPGSPDRIMRSLRQGGTIGYRLISRAKSLYHIEFVRPAKKVRS